MQSYEFFSYVVSGTHGKGTDKIEIENAKNQLVTKDRMLCPMENCCQGYGKNAERLNPSAFLTDSICMVVSYFLQVELFLVDRPPCMPDICQHKRYEDADNGHCGKRELAGTRILDSERRL